MKVFKKWSIYFALMAVAIVVWMGFEIMIHFVADVDVHFLFRLGYILITSIGCYTIAHQLVYEKDQVTD